MRSLSARRAWIEIELRRQPAKPACVALRKESVDRNLNFFKLQRSIDKSLSARRAWIEIRLFVWIAKRALSLSARRAWIEIL